MGLSLYLSYAIKTSKFGLGLLAIGQNEDAAAILGVPTRALQGAGLQRLRLPAGDRRRALFFQERLHPADPTPSICRCRPRRSSIVMLGGQGTVTGAALGAFLYEELRGYLLTSSTFANFQLVVSGALLLVIVLFFPGGLMGWIYSRFPRTQKVLE